MQDMNRAEDMSLTMYSHGSPRQSPKWFSGLLSYSLLPHIERQKGTAFAVL